MGLENYLNSPLSWLLLDSDWWLDVMILSVKNLTFCFTERKHNWICCKSITKLSFFSWLLNKGPKWLWVLSFCSSETSFMHDTDVLSIKTIKTVASCSIVFTRSDSCLCPADERKSDTRRSFSSLLVSTTPGGNLCFFLKRSKQWRMSRETIWLCFHPRLQRKNVVKKTTFRSGSLNVHRDLIGLW